METGSVTTPFGRRSMTLGLLASQVVAREIAPDASVDKWKLFRSVCAARPHLGVSDRALSVLNALLSFYPQAELRAGSGLVVFPSNAQLSLRTHGMAETTLRRHLAVLCEAGLIIRKDSPNGKRYARKDRSGDIDRAFGFSLAPLLARLGEIEALAAEIMAERLEVQRLRERLTLCRRDIAKLIEAALEAGARGDWESIHLHFRSLVTAVPRVAASNVLDDCVNDLEALRADIANHLELQLNLQKTDGNDVQNGRHIQNSKSESLSELEPRFETKQGAPSPENPDLRQMPMNGTGEDDAAAVTADEDREGRGPAEFAGRGTSGSAGPFGTGLEGGLRVGLRGEAALGVPLGAGIDPASGGQRPDGGVRATRLDERRRAAGWLAGSASGLPGDGAGVPTGTVMEPGAPETRAETGTRTGTERSADAVVPPKPLPLSLVLSACPEIVAYGPGGTIGNWRDLMSAAVLVRGMLGVSPSAYQDACMIMGPENAATVIAGILERAGHINSAGGYLRDLTRRAERGEFAIGSMIMALARAHGNGNRRTG